MFAVSRSAGVGLLCVVVGFGLVAQPMAQTVPQPRPDGVAALTEMTEVAAVSPQPTVPQPNTAPVADTAMVGPVTGYALPRYVSMRAGEGNARRGPSRSHRIDWVFTRRHMPMMIVAEHGHWRRVVDREGAGGWMHYSLLSGERTAIVEEDMLALHIRPDATSHVRAYAELGVTGRLRQCVPDWCLFEADGHRGWVQTTALWGVDPGEVFD